MATIWKRKDRDMWAVDYRDVTGKRIRLTAATRQDAETLLAEKIKESKEAHPLAADLRDFQKLQAAVEEPGDGCLIGGIQYRAASSSATRDFVAQL